jgi:hypothetical protein
MPSTPLVVLSCLVALVLFGQVCRLLFFLTHSFRFRSLTRTTTTTGASS